ncbi:serine/threonine-protein kinase [Sphaerisporangium aureirubrum]|uniref:non-specific serine/threonine protein kinase n=1 Tax=Sphaerisporangium aureirubrum TaxID=1544736 RepID=A0ABW1NPC4_9ACTN
MGTPGQLIVKRYRLVRALGQGGMGMVWEGHDTLLDRPVAAKEVLVPPKLSTRQRLDMIHRTSREARTAAKLHHRNIVSVFDVAEEDGQPWIIMEMVPSRSLDRVIAGEGPLSVTRAAVIASQVLTALSVAHAADVVHRDVKPANILIGYDGRVVLSDFGIATSMSDPHAQHSGTVGSPGFLAPERQAGAPAAPAGDLWSLGATLFAMVVCRPPFDGDMGPLATLLTKDAEFAKAPAELRPVITGLLAKDPAKRMGAEEAKRLLDAVASPEPEPERPQRATGRAKMLAGVVAAAVLAGTVGGWAVLRPDSAATAGPVPTAPAPDVASPLAVPNVTPSPTPSRLKLKWHDGEGWRAGVPRGWRLVSRDGTFTWSEPAGTAYLSVSVSPLAGRDPLALLQETETALSAEVRKYRRVRLEKVPGKDVTAEWESTWTGPGYHGWAVKGVAYHETQRIIVNGDRVSVVGWVTTRSEWRHLTPTMKAIFKYYRPAQPPA